MRKPSAPPNSSRWRDLLAPLASLRFTVLLLALCMIVIFTGTSIQKELDVFEVQRRFFHAFFIWIDLRFFVPLWPWGFAHLPGKIPMLGGYSLIALLLLNLLAAHSVRFTLSRKRIGIILIHGGLILLLVGEIVTSLFAVEGLMVIDEGQTVQYTMDVQRPELAIVDPSSPDADTVMVVPAAKISRVGSTIDDPALPFAIHVESFFANSMILGPFQMKQLGKTPDARATAGMGKGVTVIDQPRVSGVDSGENEPAAYLTLSKNGQSLGTFLVSLGLGAPQNVSVDGKTYQIELRWKRVYKPYSITLLKFSHDRYTGTDVAKNFASLVQLRDPSRGEDREVKIWMNHPLRYAGDTVYQASFKKGDKTTILQIVRNPGWLIPYISCTLVALGLLFHFGAHLLTFLRRTRAALALQPKRAGALWPGIITAACALFLFAQGRPPKIDGNFDLNAFGRLPISYEGRVMPLDTLARVSLRILSNKSDFYADDGRKIPAIEWLAGAMSQLPQASTQKVFRIDQPEILSLLSLSPDQKLFSFADLMPHAQEIDAQVSQISAIPAKQRDLFQAKLFELAQHVSLFMRLAEGDSLYFAPPTTAGEDWKTLAASAQDAKLNTDHPIAPQTLNPGLAAYIALTQSYHAQNAGDFNDAVDQYAKYVQRNLPDVHDRVSFETLFNYFDPFMNAIALYVLAFVLVCASWLIAPARAMLQRTARWVLTLTFAFHTIGLVARIYIQGRPPVTNLYSSAIFIGWGAVLFCLVLEKLYRNGIGTMTASVIAFPTLIIAHYLAATGDTMAMLQAVLDTNIWLATHVVVVTFGYMATFLAGILACVYIIGRVCFGAFGDDASRKSMTRMTYGIICFALLFSFVGTVLGGIWADQSWGRFWGWDPKENGAVLIVLWNAIVLHSRWAGLVKEDRGMMNLAVLGNIVTAWSWFGTNMLGVGLHSYGFMDSAVSWLSAFVVLQLAIFTVGLVFVSKVGVGGAKRTRKSEPSK